VTEYDTDEANRDHDQRRDHRQNPASYSRPATVRMSIVVMVVPLLGCIACVIAHSFSSVVGPATSSPGFRVATPFT
jgi:hypothetical protein